MEEEEKWVRVADFQATSHRLYGVKNWLAVFIGTQIFGLLILYGNLDHAARAAGMGVFDMLRLDHPIANKMARESLFQVIVAGVIFWSAYSKNEMFRHISTAVLVIYAVFMLLSSNGSVGRGAIIENAGLILYVVVWIAYLQFSGRVRVTFEHCVHRDDPLAETSMYRTVDENPVQEVDDPDIGDGESTARQSPLSAPVMGTMVIRDSEEDLWAAALAEFESGEGRPGLWARVFAQANGNADAAMAAYLRERVVQLAEGR